MLTLFKLHLNKNHSQMLVDNLRDNESIVAVFSGDSLN